ISSNACQTSSTACSNEIIKRVMRSSVTGNTPFSLMDWKNGITEPREPITLPYRTTEKRVPCSPEYELEATNSLSEASFVAPYRFIGELALSVDKATQPLMLWSMQASMTFIAPLILVLMHSNGLYSAVGTILVAAACTT